MNPHQKVFSASNYRLETQKRNCMVKYKWHRNESVWRSDDEQVGITITQLWNNNPCGYWRDDIFSI